MKKPGIDLRRLDLRKRLDAAGVGAHLESVAAAQCIEIRTRSRRGASSEATSEQVREIGLRLVGGELDAVQLRFVQDGVPLCDTVMRVGDGYRLVRIAEVTDLLLPRIVARRRDSAACLKGASEAGFARRSELGCGEARAAASRLPASTMNISEKGDDDCRLQRSK